MAIEIPEQLKEIAEQINHGHERTEIVRTLLSWFGFERRLLEGAPDSQGTQAPKAPDRTRL